MNVNEYIPFAKMIASKYHRIYHRYYTYEEILSSAYLGLMIASTKFDPKKNFSFTTFSYFWIRGKILDTITAEARNSARFSSEEFEVSCEEKKKEIDIEDLLNRLTDQDKHIVVEHLFNELSFQKIANNLLKTCTDRKYNDSETLSRSWTSRKYNKAIQSLREFL